jgi:SWIB/MDM2 domain
MRESLIPNPYPSFPSSTQREMCSYYGAATGPWGRQSRPTTKNTLADVVGSKPIPRTEVTKRLWAYIKKNKLQDQKNKRMIKADDTLKAVFGGKSTVNMFEMTKLVNKHLKA